MLDFKKQIRQAVIQSGVNIGKEDIEKIVEQVDIQLDRTVPNSIFNIIVVNVLSDLQWHLQEMRKKLE